MPGAPSRWSAGKDLSWEPLRSERVCEVRYDHLQGDRFRHATVFLRWRLDKPPRACAAMTSWSPRRPTNRRMCFALYRGMDETFIWSRRVPTMERSAQADAPDPNVRRDRR